MVPVSDVEQTSDMTDQDDGSIVAERDNARDMIDRVPEEDDMNNTPMMGNGEASDMVKPIAIGEPELLALNNTSNTSDQNSKQTDRKPEIKDEENSSNMVGLVDINPTRGDQQPDSDARDMPGPCVDVIRDEAEFVLQSPNYPFPYPNNLDCLTKVERLGPNICSLELRFDEFKVQPSQVSFFLFFAFINIFP